MAVGFEHRRPRDPAGNALAAFTAAAVTNNVE